MTSSFPKQANIAEAATSPRQDNADKSYTAFFHTLRNAHNRVVLGIDVLINKPMDDAERRQRIEKLQDAARQITELLDQAPAPPGR